MSDKTYWRIICDNDGHYYVIECGDEFAFWKWVHDMANDRDSEFDFDACRVDGLHSVFFSDWDTK